MQGPSRSGQASAAAACTPRRHLLHSCAGRAPTLLPHGTHVAAAWPPWHSIPPPHLPDNHKWTAPCPSFRPCPLHAADIHWHQASLVRLAGRVAATMRVWETLTLALLCPRVRRYKRPTSLIVHPSIAGRILFNGEHRPHPPLFSPARPTVASSPRCRIFHVCRLSSSTSPRRST
jgi:hypothetical protein